MASSASTLPSSLSAQILPLMRNPNLSRNSQKIEILLFGSAEILTSITYQLKLSNSKRCRKRSSLSFIVKLFTEIFVSDNLIFSTKKFLNLAQISSVVSGVSKSSRRRCGSSCVAFKLSRNLLQK